MNRTKSILVAAGVSLAMAFTFSCAFFDGDVEYGTFEFGGQKYKTIKINGKTWMAENLNFDTKDNGSVCSYDCATYGRLYNWNTATQICPSGWHLPKDGEFEKLRGDLQNTDYCAETSDTRKNYCGFYAQLGGGLIQGGSNVTIQGNIWWSSSEPPYSSWYNSGYLDGSLQKSKSSSQDQTYYYYSVRCIKN